jgi:hypothetical protein
MTVEIDHMESDFEEDALADHMVRATSIPVREIRVLGRLDDD